MIDDDNFETRLQDFDAVLIPGGFGKRGIAGMIRAISFARRSRTPFLGICLGMQTACIEFARTVANLKDADSTEFDQETPFPVIFKLRDLVDVEELGGTMRLGAWDCELTENSLAREIYHNAAQISERHRHRYEFNPEFRQILTDHGLRVSGVSTNGKFVEIIELERENHPFFVGCQFHPEYKSKPLQAHPLFVAFVRAAHENRLNTENAIHKSADPPKTERAHEIVAAREMAAAARED